MPTSSNKANPMREFSLNLDGDAMRARVSFGGKVELRRGSGAWVPVPGCRVNTADIGSDISKRFSLVSGGRPGTRRLLVACDQEVQIFDVTDSGSNSINVARLVSCGSSTECGAVFGVNAKHLVGVSAAALRDGRLAVVNTYRLPAGGGCTGVQYFNASDGSKRCEGKPISDRAHNGVRSMQGNGSFQATAEEGCEGEYYASFIADDCVDEGWAMVRPDDARFAPRFFRCRLDSPPDADLCSEQEGTAGRAVGVDCRGRPYASSEIPRGVSAAASCPPLSGAASSTSTPLGAATSVGLVASASPAAIIAAVFGVVAMLAVMFLLGCACNAWRRRTRHASALAAGFATVGYDNINLDEIWDDEEQCQSTAAYGSDATATDDALSGSLSDVSLLPSERKARRSGHAMY